MRVGISIPKVSAARYTASLPDVRSNPLMTAPFTFPANNEIFNRIGEPCCKGNNRFILALAWPTGAAGSSLGQRAQPDSKMLQV